MNCGLCSKLLDEGERGSICRECTHLPHGEYVLLAMLRVLVEKLEGIGASLEGINVNLDTYVTRDYDR